MADSDVCLLAQQGFDMAVVEQAVLPDASGCGDALVWLRTPKIAHLVGAGGCGMRALAQVFLDLDCGWTLSEASSFWM